MATNNNDSRPSRNYGDANNERHSSAHRNYNVERRPQREDGNYRPSYEENYNRNYENASTPQEGGRKRRPRVGRESLQALMVQEESGVIITRAMLLAGTGMTASKSGPEEGG